MRTMPTMHRMAKTARESAAACMRGAGPDRARRARAARTSRKDQSNSRANTALRVAAQPLARSRTHLGNFYRRLRGRLGAPQAITATAHKLARIVYHLLTTGQAYDESVFLLADQRQAQRQEKHLRKQASSLGFQLIPIAA